MVCYRAPIKFRGMRDNVRTDGFKLCLGALLLAASAPASAQISGGDVSVTFVDAVRSGDNNKALELLQSRPTLINARDAKGDTALIVAIGERNDGWTPHLLRSGANPNLASTRTGDTPLIAAVRVGYAEAIDWLIGLKVKVDATNRMGETPLIIAVQQRNRAAVAKLLAAGANPDKADSAAGYSARDYAKRDTRSREILRLIESSKPPAAAAKL
jgi:ankyrin repeat protein